MNVLVAYDVNTETAEGRRRLRKVAKLCEGVGQRVQKSVFELSVTDTQLERTRFALMDLIDHEKDSLRIYRLPGDRETLVEVFGRDAYIDFEGDPLVF